MSKYFALAVFSLASALGSLSADAAVVRLGGNAPLGSVGSPYSVLGFWRAASYLRLSSDDNWTTADIELEIQANFAPYSYHTFFLQWDGDVSPVASTPAYFAFFDPSTSQSYAYSKELYSDGDKFRVRIGSAQLPVWSALSSGGFFIEHDFFGNEFFYRYNVSLGDRSQKRIQFDLNDPAAVPVPASAVMTLGGLGALLMGKRRRAGTR